MVLSPLSQPPTSGHGMFVSQAPLQPCPRPTPGAPGQPLSICGQRGALSLASLQWNKHVWSKSKVGQGCSEAIPWRPSGGEGGPDGSIPASLPRRDAGAHSTAPRPSPSGHSLTFTALLPSWSHRLSSFLGSPPRQLHIPTSLFRVCFCESNKLSSVQRHCRARSSWSGLVSAQQQEPALVGRGTVSTPHGHALRCCLCIWLTR